MCTCCIHLSCDWLYLVIKSNLWCHNFVNVHTYMHMHSYYGYLFGYYLAAKPARQLVCTYDDW